MYGAPLCSGGFITGSAEVVPDRAHGADCTGDRADACVAADPTRRRGTVIVFGICAGPGDRLERVSLPGIERARDADSEVIVLRGQSSIGSAYNTILDRAAAGSHVEAVVFLHDDLRIVDPDACSAVRSAVAEPDVAIVGVIGGRSPTEMSWASGPAVGTLVEVSQDGEISHEIHGDPRTGTHDADTVDGVFMVFSPWAIAHLRFDTRRFPGFDGYDADVCAEARSQGKRVLTAPITVEHVCLDPAGAYALRSTNRQAALAWRAKWRTDQPRWRRAWWGLRSRFLRLEFRLRRMEWGS